MDGILQGIPHCICYLDDILVTGRSDKEHVENLKRVLQSLQKHGVRLRCDKCSFFQKSVEYLGHTCTINAEGVHTTTKKVKAIIVDVPSPRNVPELKSFLGLLNYYGKFLPNLATILHPLHSLLQAGQSWKWSHQCKQAFDKAKKALIEAPILFHYNPDLPISLAGDASAYGVGAVLSHSMPDGTERPVAFVSRTLSASERNYSQVAKEALSLVFGIKKFLYGRHFTMITDHKPLTTILGPKQGITPVAAARMQRWALLLSAYSYSIKFCPMEAHCNADGLSHLPLQADTAVGNPEDPAVSNMMQISSLPVHAADVARATCKDPVLSKVLLFMRRGWPDDMQETLKPYFRRCHELTMEGDILLWGMRVVIPSKLRELVLQELATKEL